MKKKILYLVFSVFCFIGCYMNVDAASLGISASSTSVNPGGTVTIKVSGSGLAGKFSVTSSNSGVLSGGTNSVWLEDSSSSYKFTAKSLGKATITLKAIDASDKSGNQYNGSKSITINVVKPREKSKVDTLKGLSIEGYTISPEFNKDTLEYTVEIGDTIDKVNVNFTKGDSYQNVEGAGTRDVIEGENKLEIVVTSETGSKKTYVINANVKDNNPINVDVDGVSYTVVKRSSVLTKPEDFEESKVTINDIEIPAFVNEKVKLTLVGLKNSDGKIGLFIYDNGTYKKYDLVKSSSLSIVSSVPSNIPEGYKLEEITINEEKINVYKNEKHTLIYGLNLSTNEEDWYQYDESDNSLQKYDYLEIQDLKKDYENKCNLYLYLAIGLGSLCVIILIVLLVVIIKKNNKGKQIKEYEEIEEEKPSKKESKEIKKVEKTEKEDKELETGHRRRSKVEEVPYTRELAIKEINKALEDEEEMSMEFIDSKKRSKKRK